MNSMHQRCSQIQAGLCSGTSTSCSINIQPPIVTATARCPAQQCFRCNHSQIGGSFNNYQRVLYPPCYAAKPADASHETQPANDVTDASPHQDAQQSVQMQSGTDSAPQKRRQKKIAGFPKWEPPAATQQNTVATQMHDNAVDDKQRSDGNAESTFENQQGKQMSAREQQPNKDQQRKRQSRWPKKRQTLQPHLTQQQQQPQGSNDEQQSQQGDGQEGSQQSGTPSQGTSYTQRRLDARSARGVQTDIATGASIATPTWSLPGIVDVTDAYQVLQLQQSTGPVLHFSDLEKCYREVPGLSYPDPVFHMQIANRLLDERLKQNRHTTGNMILQVATTGVSEAHDMVCVLCLLSLLYAQVNPKHTLCFTINPITANSGNAAATSSQDDAQSTETTSHPANPDPNPPETSPQNSPSPQQMENSPSQSQSSSASADHGPDLASTLCFSIYSVPSSSCKGIPTPPGASLRVNKSDTVQSLGSWIQSSLSCHGHIHVSLSGRGACQTAIRGLLLAAGRLKHSGSQYGIAILPRHVDEAKRQTTVYSRTQTQTAGRNGKQRAKQKGTAGHSAQQPGLENNNDVDSGSQPEGENDSKENTSNTVVNYQQSPTQSLDMLLCLLQEGPQGSQHLNVIPATSSSWSSHSSKQMSLTSRQQPKNPDGRGQAQQPAQTEVSSNVSDSLPAQLHSHGNVGHSGHVSSPNESSIQQESEPTATESDSHHTDTHDSSIVDTKVQDTAVRASGSDQDAEALPDAQSWTQQEEVEPSEGWDQVENVQRVVVEKTQLSASAFATQVLAMTNKGKPCILLARGMPQTMRLSRVLLLASERLVEQRIVEKARQQEEMQLLQWQQHQAALEQAALGAEWQQLQQERVQQQQEQLLQRQQQIIAAQEQADMNAAVEAASDPGVVGGTNNAATQLHSGSSTAQNTGNGGSGLLSRPTLPSPQTTPILAPRPVQPLLPDLETTAEPSTEQVSTEAVESVEQISSGAGNAPLLEIPPGMYDTPEQFGSVLLFKVRKYPDEEDSEVFHLFPSYYGIAFETKQVPIKTVHDYLAKCVRPSRRHNTFIKVEEPYRLKTARATVRSSDQKPSKQSNAERAQGPPETANPFGATSPLEISDVDQGLQDNGQADPLNVQDLMFDVVGGRSGSNSFGDEDLNDFHLGVEDQESVIHGDDQDNDDDVDDSSWGNPVEAEPFPLDNWDFNNLVRAILWNLGQSNVAYLACMGKGATAEAFEALAVVNDVLALRGGLQAVAKMANQRRQAQSGSPPSTLITVMLATDLVQGQLADPTKPPIAQIQKKARQR